MSDDALIEALAARQWQRMTRSTTTYAELNAADQAACRALVTPVLADIRDLTAAPQSPSPHGQPFQAKSQQ